MQTGWLYTGGTWYYLAESGAMQTGWLEYNNKTYYLFGSGAMAVGNQYIGGVLYYFNSSGALVSAVSIPSNPDQGQAIVDYAMQWVGVTPYVPAAQRWNGSYYTNSLTEGTDCSGFVHLIFAEFGYDLPYSSSSYQNSVGVKIPYDQIMPGDIVVFGYGSHVGIYAGNNKMVHCATPERGTVYANVYEIPTACVRVVQ